MGQYVTRGGKQYYKGDDGKLYTSFQGANAARIGNTLEGQLAGGVASFLNAASAVPGAMASAFYDPTKRFGRPANASQIGPSTSLLTQGDPTGRYAPVSMQTRDYNAWRGGGAPTAPILPPADSRTPITSPNTTFQNADEEYKTLLSQYGGTSGVQQLAGMQSLPTGFTPTGGKQAAGLEDYYSAQRAVGSRNIGEITGALAASDPRYQKGGTLERWAIANPMLAMREFNKKFPAGAPTQGPSDEAIRAAMGGGTYFPSEGSPSPIANPPSLAGQSSFSTVANSVPAPPPQQGAAVSAPYAEATAKALEKTAGATGMPNLETTAKPPVLNRIGDFLQKTGLGSAFNAAGAAGLSKLLNVN